MESPDAWDIGAAAPGVAIELGRELDEVEFGSAFGRWRRQWVERLTLEWWQEKARNKLSPTAFGRKARSWFEAWLNNYFGNRHVARTIIRYGTTDVELVTRLVDAIGEEKKEEAKKRRREEEAHGAGEPVWQLKLDAHLARRALRDGERLNRNLNRGKIELERLSPQQRQVLEDFDAGRLHARVDRANLAYGHGIARTHQFGFLPGENMCRHVPIEVRAHLRTLQTWGDPAAL